jgi:predicted dienelactone hydrolase
MATPAAEPRTHRTLWRIVAALVCLCAIAALGLYIPLVRFRLPAPTGPYAVGTTILSFTDESRHEDHVADPSVKRTVVVQLWYPAESSANPLARYNRWGETTTSTFYTPLLRTNSRVDAPVANNGAPFPVLLFGHRWGGERTQNTDLAEELASHGYVVAAIDHPYNSARALMPDGSVVKNEEALEGPKGAAATAAEQIAFWNKTLDVWAADEIFVLNQLAALPGPLHGRLDTDHAGAFGHSFGGSAALRLLGLDPRIKAAVNLDGWTFGALKDRTQQPVMIEYEQITVPRRQQLMSLPEPGTLEDQLDRADFAAVDASLNRFGGDRLYIAGTQHLDFSDQPLLPPLRRLAYTGPIAPERIQAILRQTVLEFFDQNLRGRPSTLLQPRQSQFGELTVGHVSSHEPYQP